MGKTYFGHLGHLLSEQYCMSFSSSQNIRPVYVGLWKGVCYLQKKVTIPPSDEA